MARIKKEDEMFVIKGRKFINFLMDVESIRPLSIARVIGATDKHRVVNGKLGKKNILVIMKAYSNNYEKFCKLHGYEVEKEITEYLKKLYE